MMPLLTKSEILNIFRGCTAWFVSDLFGIPDCWFSDMKAIFHFPGYLLNVNE